MNFLAPDMNTVEAFENRYGWTYPNGNREALCKSYLGMLPKNTGLEVSKK